MSIQVDVDAETFLSAVRQDKVVVMIQVSPAIMTAQPIYFPMHGPEESKSSDAQIIGYSVPELLSIMIFYDGLTIAVNQDGSKPLRGKMFHLGMQRNKRPEVELMRTARGELILSLFGMSFWLELAVKFEEEVQVYKVSARRAES